MNLSNGKKKISSFDFWMLNLTKMTYLTICQIEHLVKLDKKLTNGWTSQLGHPIKLGKVKWHL
jgi:hypothetical protein